jgi:hypothetical protein
METPRKMVPNHRNYTEKRRAAQALAQKMLMLFFLRSSINPRAHPDGRERTAEERDDFHLLTKIKV